MRFLSTRNHLFDYIILFVKLTQWGLTKMFISFSWKGGFETCVVTSLQHLSVRCFPTCSRSACLLSSSRRSCSISSYLLLCSRSCCFLSSRSRRCCCRWEPFHTAEPQLCVFLHVRCVSLPSRWANGANNQGVRGFAWRTRAFFKIKAEMFSRVKITAG